MIIVEPVESWCFMLRYIDIIMYIRAKKCTYHLSMKVYEINEDAKQATQYSIILRLSLQVLCTREVIPCIERCAQRGACT